MAQSAIDLNAYRRKRALAGSKKVHGEIAGAKPAKLPAFVKPQLATLVDAVPPGNEWLHEIKLDGYRTLCRIDHGRVTLLTRRAQDWTERFKSIAAAAKRLPVGEAFLDGEVVALDEEGKSSFQRLQNFMKGSGASPLVYFAFDLLHIDGCDLKGAALETRKEMLQKLLESSGEPDGKDSLRYSPHWIGQGEALYRECCRRGLEGIISKRRDQPYRSDRGRDWLKVKCVQRQEFIIGGFTEPAGTRVGLGALLLGVHDERGQLRYVGRVGTGFSERSLRELRARLNELARKTSPFINPPKGREASGVHWVEPELVGEVAFSEWTEDNLLRHPSFQGLREDKAPAEIFREKSTHLQKTMEKRSGQKNSENGSDQKDMENSSGQKNTEKRSGQKNMENGSGKQMEIAGIQITHPDRVLYPEQNITKRELALYYEETADWILPHLERRPLTLVRCPRGRDKYCFYQRHVRESLHEAIHRVSAKEGKSVAEYVWIDSFAGLIALAQMGVLEIHTWGSRADRIDQPDQLIFDLDPDPSVSWQQLKQAAHSLRDRLVHLGLSPFVKTTGGKGLHIVVPITPKEDWDFAKDFSKAIAESMVGEAPERYTATMSKIKRKGKIYIDYLRNARAASAICPYSTRALPGAPVSAPLRWDELVRDVRSKFNINTMRERLAHSKQSPWEHFDEARVPITRTMLKRLEA
jgi:bifunctional non-homologous end joining protein LigD